MTDLDKLIEAVEAGKPFMSYHMGSNSIGYGMSVANAFEGSLDAALKLHEALLTKDCHWSISEDDDRGYVARVFLTMWHEGVSAKPARAWLLAILHAYRSTQGEAG